MIRLRSICSSDEAFLLRVYASTRRDELQFLEWDAHTERDFLTSQFTAQQRFYRENFPDADFQVILRDDKPIGRLYVERRSDEIRLIDIALLPEFRRAGTGSKLLETLLAEARLCDLPVRIHVGKDNPATRLYKRLGFRQVEDQGIYYLMEWTAD